MLEKYYNKHGKIWLNVASSIYVLEDFVNLDNHIFLHYRNGLPFLKRILPKKYAGLIDDYIEASGKATMVKHDCRKDLKFPDNSVDHILCSHFLEHIYPNDTDNILKSFYSVLADGGTVHLIVPDINVQVQRYLRAKERGMDDAADAFMQNSLLSKTDMGSFKYRLLEFHGGFGLQHRWMYDYESLKIKLVKAGFEVLKENSTPSKGFRENDDSVHLVGIKRSKMN